MEAVERGCPEPSAAAQRAHALATVSEHAAPVGWRGACAAAAGRETTRPVLQELDLWLQREVPELWTRLQWELHEIEGRIVRQVQALHGVAVASADGCATGEESPVDRYVRVFQGLIERVSLLIGERDQLVVTTAAFGSKEHGRVEASALGGAIAGLLGRYQGRVVPAVPRPQPYDRDDVDPGLVLADLVINRLRRTQGSWASVVKQVERWLGIPIEVVTDLTPVAGPLPSLAHEGPPRAIVAEALEGGAPTIPGDLEPPWAREQAAAWVRALRRLP